MWKLIDMVVVGFIVLIAAIISLKKIKNFFQNKEVQDSPCCGCSNRNCPYKIQEDESSKSI